jgi:tRNA U34 5-methylaminomethyl-2-thiouridine-forming methyltransferase MnmC
MPSLILTQDGSHSLLHEQLNETYHSTHGAIQESKHVFIEKGLMEFPPGKQEKLRVLEVGFGTGLNALLAFEFGERSSRTVEYHTLEAFPLSRDIWSQLNYVESLGMRDTFEMLHSVSWGNTHLLGKHFEFCKTNVLLQDAALLAGNYNVVFFDAFAPSKQPEMWTEGVLSKVCDAIAPGGIFVTYCAKGQLKRDLRSIGMLVETLPGPPGKKEMVRARRPNTV